jgi:O-antigen/teichoic acid export membrane protein
MTADAAKISESSLKKLVVHASHYGLTSVFTMVAGLVSFPLLTRLFSVADYGVMNLVAATITISVAVGKFGVQHSILRYQSEVSAEKSPYTMPQLISTTFFGMVATGVLTAAVLAGGAQLVPERWLADPRLRFLFIIAAGVVLVQVVESALVNFVRAEQRTTAYMKYQIGKKYLTLASIVVALLLIRRSLGSFYAANLLSESLALGGLMYVLFYGNGRRRPRTAEFSRPLYRELIAFGIPMMIGYEMSGIVLAVGDRYVIEGILGAEPLGLYAAAYNLCQYVQAVFIVSIGQAIMPIYMKMYDERGPAETSQFISGSLSRYLMFGAPVVAGVAAVGPELLPSLASEKYVAAVSVLPWVIAGMVVDGTNSMAGAGLFIHRKTRHIMAIVMTGALGNIGLNLVLVPRIGIVGSAAATLISYTFTSLALAFAGRNLLRVAVPWGTLARATAAATAMYFAIARIWPGHRLATVGVRTAIGGVAYLALMLAIDADARALVGKVLRRK